jgi:hypothetical protein
VQTQLQVQRATRDAEEALSRKHQTAVAELRTQHSAQLQAQDTAHKRELKAVEDTLHSEQTERRRTEQSLEQLTKVNQELHDTINSMKAHSAGMFMSPLNTLHVIGLLLCWLY